MPRLSIALERLQEWDLRVCTRANNAVQANALKRAMRLVSRLGDGVIWYALMLAMLVADARTAGPVLHMILAGLAATAVYKLLKHGTLRPRPYQVHAHIAAGTAALDQFSFPSGHTLHAVAFSMVACTYYPWLAVPLVPLTLAIAASRVTLGLHYPSDVIAGVCLGATIAALSFLP